MNGRFQGYLCGILSAAAYGLNPLFGIPLFRDGMPTSCILFYRFSFAAVMLATWMIATKKSFVLPLRMVLPSALGGILVSSSSIFWYMSFRIMDTGIAATILFVYPLMVALIMAVFFHERIRFRTAAGMVLATLGVAVLCRPGNGCVNFAGVAYVLLSALTYAIYIVEVRESQLRKLPPETLTFYMLIFALPVFLTVLRGGADLQGIVTARQWLCLLGVAFFPSLISFLLMAFAVRSIGATPTAILGALEPLTAVFVGIFVFGERMTTALFAGILLVLTAVMLVVIPARE